MEVGSPYKQTRTSFNTQQNISTMSQAKLQLRALFLLAFWSFTITLSYSQGSQSTPQIALGQSFSLALKANGTVWAWGSNDRGQLGNGNKRHSTTPEQVIGLPPVVSIAATQRTAYAIDQNGKLWIWGSTYDLSETSLKNTDALKPIQVPDIQGLISISAGKNHVLALDNNGNIYAWGAGTNGKLGLGDNKTRLLPTRLNGINQVVQVAAGGEYSLALKSDGTVWAWGDNNHAQLGNSNSKSATTPIQVAGITGVKQIAAGNSTFAMAITQDGTVWAWGQNQSANPFGFGTKANPGEGVRTYDRPVATPFNNAKSVSINGTSTVVLKNDGTIWVAGIYSRSLGVIPALIPGNHEHISNVPNSNSRRVPIPTQAAGYANIHAIGIPWGQGSGHIQFISQNGDVWGSGNNNRGQLGNPQQTETYRQQPTKAAINLTF
jgi:alpha-tubulin suppressor-like RCC1 family protein